MWCSAIWQQRSIVQSGYECTSILILFCAAKIKKAIMLFIKSIAMAPPVHRGPLWDNAHCATSCWLIHITHARSRDKESHSKMVFLYSLIISEDFNSALSFCFQCTDTVCFHDLFPCFLLPLCVQIHVITKNFINILVIAQQFIEICKFKHFLLEKFYILQKLSLQIIITLRILYAKYG